MDVELNGVEYRLEKIDARRQFHVMRRLSPMLAELSEAVSGGKGSDEILSPLANALSKMTDADADYCLMTLLTGARRKQGATWSKVVVDDQLMFADISMADMLQLAFKAFQLNFDSFFQSLPQISTVTTSRG